MINDTESVRIAVIIGAHGIHGRLKIFVVSDIPDRFEAGRTVMLQHKGVSREVEIGSFAFQKGRTGLLQLADVGDRNAAEALKGAELFITREEAEEARKNFDSDTFFYFDIIGCAVFLNDSPFGTVTDILEAGSGEILIITRQGGETHMVPFVESMVDTGRLSDGRIDIHPVEGLLDI